MPFTAIQASDLSAMVPGDVLQSYNQYIGDRDPLAIVDFQGPMSRRDVVEMVLLQQALHLGDYDGKVRFIIADTYSRILQDISDGRIAMSGNTVWLNDVEMHKDKLFISAATVASGEFEAGLYTVASNTKALTTTNPNDIRQLSAVSNRAWAVDWKTLESLGLKRLLHTVKWNSMTRMVEAGRADFLLAPFQNSPDLSFEAAGIRFVPIPQFKVGLIGSRHYIISKAYSNSEAITQAFETGMAQLLEQNIVAKAYRESGFFNSKVDGWQKLQFDNTK